MIALAIIAALVAGGAGCIAVVAGFSRALARRSVLGPELLADPRFARARRRREVARFDDGVVVLEIASHQSRFAMATWTVRARLASSSLIEGPGYAVLPREGSDVVVSRAKLTNAQLAPGLNVVDVPELTASSTASPNAPGSHEPVELIVRAVSAGAARKFLELERTRLAVRTLFERHEAFAVNSFHGGLVVDLDATAALDVRALEVIAELARSISGQPAAARPAELRAETAGAESGAPIVVPAARD